MIRETSHADSRYVLLALTPSNGVVLQARTATHVTPTISIQVAGKTGVWLEVVRNGSSFSGYVSTDGTAWKLVGSVVIPMVNNVRAGLAVTAHNNTQDLHGDVQQCGDCTGGNRSLGVVGGCGGADGAMGVGEFFL